MKVGVIDYGVGNLGSVVRTLEALGEVPVLVSRAVDLKSCDRLILPGVGNFRDCSKLLNDGGWLEALRNEVLGYNKPLLGICLGMQLLAESGTEGSKYGESFPGLGLIPGQVRHLSSLGCSLRLPHVGWNCISRIRNEGNLFSQIPDGTDFYFVHSYAFAPSDSADVVASVDYGVVVTAAVRRGHIFGTQFHPEKSSRAGFQLLKNFIQELEC
jgi:glutamine amidotransferase